MTPVIIVLITIFIDQISKYIAFSVLKGNSSIVIIKNFLHLSYVENRGAAWGILQNQRILLIGITLVVVMGLAIYVRSNTTLTKPTLISISLIVGGAIGNLIDRVKLGYVIDFIDVKFGNLYNFPVFNFADSFIVIGTFLMMVLIMTDKFGKHEWKEWFYDSKAV